MNQSDFDILDRVSKGAELTVLTLANLVGVEVTEFCLILLLVIQTFNSVVGPFAFLPFGTSVSLCELTEFRSIQIVVSSSVFE